MMAALLASCASLFFYFYTLRAEAASDPGFLEAGFQFDYTPSGAPVPIPTTAQCDEIPLSWGRASFTTGGNPEAPYFIQVYTSTFLFPSIINVGSGLSDNWPVPYVPGTQYQICMFANNGVSGGCQRMTTVIPAVNSTVDNPPTCTNLTYPQGILDVAAFDHTGNMSQYGWVDQCTDIMVQPLNGTPPFTMTVAPALHPPWNITSNDMSPINWTVQLSWASSFFISLVDSTGMSWAYGPLHSGGEGPTKCLTLGDEDGGLPKAAAAGAGIGGLIGGLAIGAVGAFFFFRRRQRRGPYYDNLHSDRIQSYDVAGGNGKSPLDSDEGVALPQSAAPAPVGSIRKSGTSRNNRNVLPAGSGYEVEPFAMPDRTNNDDEGVRRGEQQLSLVPDSRSREHSENSVTAGTLEAPSNPGRSGTAAGNSGQVYVVHHDGGRAPVTVYTSEGTEVIELPPRYDNNPQERPRFEERRMLGPRPRKNPRE